ncbi:hypothetical protein BJV78DRAFT_1151862 [Lactifluus subvellereus]|nr:hypothetical protein BJV78DRAFT_1151862 [Lactifluus subvellereus]
MSSSSNPSRIERASSLSLTTTPPFDAGALLRRFSMPSPYTGGNAAAGQPAAHPIDPASQAHNQVRDPAVVPADAVTVHKYNLMSRGRDYALITVTSHASDGRDPPLLYFGEELRGFIVLLQGDLESMRSMDIILQLFDSDRTIPSGETKRVLLPQNVDSSHISGGQIRWPFSIAPPTAVVSSSSSSSAGSSFSHVSSYRHRTGPRFQLIVTIYRRGRLTRNVGVTQQIYYVPLPGSSVPSCSSPISGGRPDGLTGIPSWQPQEHPSVFVKGVLFDQNITVECKLIMPESYIASDFIPLRLVMTSESIGAIDLVKVPEIIDVRLLKAMVFGKQAKVNRGFSLRDPMPLHRTEWAALAQWELDGYPREFPPSRGHPHSRWCIELNGGLHRERPIELTASHRAPEFALMYFVCLFPFRVAGFRPAGDPKRELFMGEIQLLRQH